MRTIPRGGLMVLALLVAVAAAGIVRSQYHAKSAPRLDTLKLAPGFHIDVYADVPNARSLAVTPGGTVFVGTQHSEVYALVDRKKDGKADEVLTIAKVLRRPNG